MKLEREGENLAGTYAYDRVGQALALKGRIDQPGRFTLEEFDSGGQQTGKFSGRLMTRKDAEGATVIEGKWARPDGSRGADVVLNEQPIEFTGGLQIVAKVITGRRPDVSAAYPQIVGGSSPAISNFNRRAAAVVMKTANDIKQEESPRSYYSTRFNVLLATDDYVSVVIEEEYYAGGMYPNTSYEGVTYDLRTGKELRLDDLFRPGSNYRPAILKYALDDVNRQEKEYNEHEAPPAERHKSAGPFFSAEDVKSWTAWAMTRKGVVIYLDFPHVDEAYSRVFIPYHALAAYINPQGPAAAVSLEK